LDRMSWDRALQQALNGIRKHRGGGISRYRPDSIAKLLEGPDIGHNNVLSQRQQLVYRARRLPSVFQSKLHRNVNGVHEPEKLVLRWKIANVDINAVQFIWMSGHPLLAAEPAERQPDMRVQLLQPPHGGDNELGPLVGPRDAKCSDNDWAASLSSDFRDADLGPA